MPDISIESATGTLPSIQKTDLAQASREAGRAEATKEEASRSIKSVSDELDRKLAEEGSIQSAVDKLQSYSDRLDRNLEFSVDDTSGRTVVTVRDGATEEVIRQIPSEETLRLASEIDSGDVKFFEAHV